MNKTVFYCFSWRYLDNRSYCWKFGFDYKLIVYFNEISFFNNNLLNFSSDDSCSKAPGEIMILLKSSLSTDVVEKQSVFKGTKIAWDTLFIKPALEIASPYVRMAVAAKTKNPRSIVEIIFGARVINLTYLHGNGLRLKVVM